MPFESYTSDSLLPILNTTRLLIKPLITPEVETKEAMTFIAAARSGFLIIRDTEEEDRRLMVPIKNNLGSDKNGLSFRIKKCLLESGIETSKAARKRPYAYC